jgi:hypothetical protein
MPYLAINDGAICEFPIFIDSLRGKGLPLIVRGLQLFGNKELFRRVLQLSENRCS